MMRPPLLRVVVRSLNPLNRLPASPHRQNLLAMTVAFAAVSVLYSNFQHAPGEAEPSLARFHVAHSAALVPSPAVPVQTAMLLSEDAASPGGSENRPGRSEIPQSLSGRAALELNLQLLKQGHERLRNIPDYTASFFRRERVGTSLGEGQMIDLKLRHQPFSVYLRWTSGPDAGREVLYVEGENDGDMLVHAGGWKARLLPCVKVNPHGAMAMRESRHPITNAGLLEVARRGIVYRERDLQHADAVQCDMVVESLQDRPCYRFDIIYARREHSAEYRKTVVYIDQELSLPVCVLNYDWPTGEQQSLSGDELDEATLIEHYCYTNIRLNQRLADRDFDRANSEYSFRR